MLRSPLLSFLYPRCQRYYGNAFAAATAAAKKPVQEKTLTNEAELHDPWAYLQGEEDEAFDVSHAKNTEVGESRNASTCTKYRVAPDHEKLLDSVPVAPEKPVRHQSFYKPPAREFLGLRPGETLTQKERAIYAKIFDTVMQSASSSSRFTASDHDLPSYAQVKEGNELDAISRIAQEYSAQFSPTLRSEIERSKTFLQKQANRSSKLARQSQGRQLPKYLEAKAALDAAIAEAGPDGLRRFIDTALFAPLSMQADESTLAHTHLESVSQNASDQGQRGNLAHWDRKSRSAFYTSYPILLEDCMQHYLFDCHDPVSAVLLFQEMKEKGLESYVLGGTGTNYSLYIASLWQAYKLPSDVLTVIKEMTEHLVLADESTVQILKKIETEIEHSLSGSLGAANRIVMQMKIADNEDQRIKDARRHFEVLVNIRLTS